MYVSAFERQRHAPYHRKGISFIQDVVVATLSLDLGCRYRRFCGDKFSFTTLGRCWARIVKLL